MNRVGQYAVLIGVAAVFAVQVLRILVGFAPPLDGTFDGADSYMRLARVLECRGGIRCPNGVFPRSNAPFGEVLHWPFLEDWLLMAGAWVLRPVLAFRDALVAAGYAWGPLLSVFLVVGLVVIGKRVVPPAALWLIGVLLATQLWVLMGFGPHGVDHHGFITLLWVMTVAAAAPALAATDAGRTPAVLTGADAGRASAVLTGADAGRTSAVLTGSGLALGVWVSVETLIAAVPLVAALAIHWIVRGRAEGARFLALAFTAAAGVLAIALPTDGPRPNRLAPEYDRFSIVHVVLFALGALFWLALVARRARPSSPGRRLLVVAAGGAGVVGVTSLIFPGFVRGPLAEVPADVFTTWLSPMVEYVPALEFPAIWPAIALGPLLVALPWSVYRALRGPSAERPFWGFLAGALVWFGALAAFEQIRWTYYIHALVPVPLAAALAAAAAWLRRTQAPLAAAAGQVGAGLMVFFAPLFTLFAFASAGANAGGPPPCKGADLVRALAHVPDDSSVVLAPIFDAPEVLFRTDHAVVATPYHRNIQGSRDSFTIMQTTNFEQARDLLAARNVRWVAVCNGIAWAPHVPPDAPGSFYAALQTGDAPAWVRPLTAPAGPVTLWEVERHRR